MVYNYPFFNFPRPKRYSYYNSPYYGNYNKASFDDKKKVNFESSKASFDNMKKMNLDKIKASPRKEEVYDEPFFEIFGLKLYFDDVLIICLIFFLYQEGVKDEYLFMALILLLLSWFFMYFVTCKLILFMYFATSKLILFMYNVSMLNLF